ncbi:MAG TPA: hypothetical protein DCM40_28020, partial [Maribacter sp.]|nr:hypothetical protein [Maribacter sp.]
MAKLTKITVQYDAKVLEGITTPAGDPVYPPIQSDQEVQQALDFFTEDDSFTGLTTSLIDIQGVTPANTLSLLNDILIVRYIGNVSELPDLYEGRETGMAEA